MNIGKCRAHLIHAESLIIQAVQSDAQAINGIQGVQAPVQSQGCVP